MNILVLTILLMTFDLAFNPWGSVAHGGGLTRNDLLPTSALCQKRRQIKMDIGCDDVSPILQSHFLGSFVGLQQANQQVDLNSFATQLQEIYLDKVLHSLLNHYAALTWVTGKPPDLKRQNEIIRDISSKSKCLSKGTNKKKLEVFASRLKELKPEQHLNVEGVSQEDQAILRNEMFKRYIVASLELHRLFVSANGNDVLDRERRERINDLLAVYPLLNLDRDLLEDSKSMIESTYNTSFSARSARTLEYNSERLLYPQSSEEGLILDTLAPISADGRELVPGECEEVFKASKSVDSPLGRRCTGMFDPILVTRILNDPNSSKVRNKFIDVLNNNWSHQMSNLGQVCQMPLCTLMGLNLDTTATLINSTAHRARDTAVGYACRCEMFSASSTLNSQSKSALANMVILGSLTCPFTFGFGCLLASTGGVILTTEFLADSYTDLTKVNQSMEVAQTFPNLTTPKNLEDLYTFDQQTKEQLGSAAKITAITLLGGRSIYALTKKGQGLRLLFPKGTKAKQSPTQPK
jgi:hypothetical protein